MAIDPAPSMNRRGAFRKKLQEVIDHINGSDVVVVNGAAADTNIAVAGITTGDEIVSVIMFDTGVPSVVTAEASITSNGNIQLDTTDSTGNKLVVTWLDLT